MPAARDTEVLVAARHASPRRRYRLDGYTLELTYDSGRVERRLFFSTSERMIWFDDLIYLRDDEDSKKKK